MPILKNLIGIKFTKLLVLELVSRKPPKWLCKCDCGNEIVVKSMLLLSEHTKSCGCFRKYNTSRLNCTHNKTHSTEYIAWLAMKARCYNINSNDYHNYGAKNINVCDRWKNNFQNFYDDMGQKPGDGYSLDRIDPYGNYEPENCRWATSYTQIYNKKNTIKIIYDGITLPLAVWAQLKNINYHTLKKRYYAGWLPEKIFLNIKNNYKKPNFNKDKNAFNRIKSANKYNREGDDLTFEEWKDILEKNHYTCFYCKRSEVDIGKKLTMDHIVPKYKNGFHTKTNVVPACKSCNSSKGTSSSPRPIENRK